MAGMSKRLLLVILLATLCSTIDTSDPTMSKIIKKKQFTSSPLGLVIKKLPKWKAMKSVITRLSTSSEHVKPTPRNLSLSKDKDVDSFLKEISPLKEIILSLIKQSSQKEVSSENLYSIFAELFSSKEIKSSITNLVSSKYFARFMTEFFAAKELKSNMKRLVSSKEFTSTMKELSSSKDLKSTIRRLLSSDLKTATREQPFDTASEKLKQDSNSSKKDGVMDLRTTVRELFDTVKKTLGQDPNISSKKDDVTDLKTTVRELFDTVKEKLRQDPNISSKKDGVTDLRTIVRELFDTMKEKLGQVPNISSKKDGVTDLKTTVRELFDLLELTQVKRDRPFLAPGLWQEDKGVYPSYVRLNFVGQPAVADLREAISVFDNNMFATAWITIILLETRLYAAGPRPSDEQVLNALDAIAKHRDGNVKYVNSLMAFWPQVFDANVSMYVSTPANLLNAFRVFEELPWDSINKLLDDLGLHSVEEFLEKIRGDRSGYTRAFHIPADFDDTSVNLGLGALLADLAPDLPEPLTRWKEHNANLSSVLDAMRQYAYRPFSDDPAVNTIDPRTYYYLRHFLQYAQEKGVDVALVPTWVQSIPEARQLIDRDVVMPFQVNNVDVTVAANAVYGLTSAVLSGLLPASVLDPKQDPEIAQIYHNTTMMTAFMINNTLFGRPDLALTYYPSVFEFYWFVARTYQRMELAKNTQTLPPLMAELFPMLKATLEGAMTSHVTSGGTEEGEDMKYYDDFLGDADVDEHNQTKVKAEDRLYTTTMAVNALQTTWTLTDPDTRSVHWKTDTPSAVKDTVTKCVNWLARNILGLKFKPWNAFFSGSAKGRTTSPTEYPGNRLELLNGTRVHNYAHFPKDFFTYGMEGYIPEAEYAALVRNASAHFRRDTPTQFISYNDPTRFFPFWSSPAYTYATTMLALSRYGCIQDTDDNHGTT